MESRLLVDNVHCKINADIDSPTGTSLDIVETRAQPANVLHATDVLVEVVGPSCSVSVFSTFVVIFLWTTSGDRIYQ